MAQKKVPNAPAQGKRKLTNPGQKLIPVCKQCALLGLSRSSYYSESRKDNSYNLRLMNLIDEQFTKTPFYDVEHMTAWLHRHGQRVNHKRVRRLMRLMGLEAVYPKPRDSGVFQRTGYISLEEFREIIFIFV